MDGSVTVSMAAPAEKIWNLIADVRNTGRFSPEVMEAEWIGPATGPALGARFRGHVKRNGRGPTYWSECRVTTADVEREFAFEVVVGGKVVNRWGYVLTPTATGTDVTESFAMAPSLLTRGYWLLLGWARGRTNRNGMRETLERAKAIVEA